MTRQQLEHIIRAAATIADDEEVVVIGSQSILGQFPRAPADLCVSMEADVYPRNHPERWNLIDGSIGEGSPFHETFGYFAQGVDEHTATLPAGWKERLVAIRNENTRGMVGWTLEIHDLLISKYVANRPKDRAFCRSALRHAMADGATLQARLRSTDLPEDQQARLEALIRADLTSTANALPGD